MRLTSFTDYGLRVLIYAEAHPDELFTIADLTRVFSISKAHLMKVVNALTRAGYLEAVRGRRGGLRLLKKPADINVGEVVRALEPSAGIVECMREDNQCILCGPCKLPRLLGGAMKAFDDYLADYTLADIALKKHEF